VSSLQLFPEVIDGSTLGPSFSQPQFLPIAIEGQADSAGTGVVGSLYTILRPSEADTYFGPASSLATLVKFVLNRGISPVIATISAKGTVPNSTQRNAAWDLLESDVTARIRLTDSTTQADLVALADSCEAAELIQNKQFAVVGMPTGTSKTNYTAAATAIASKRAVLVAPAVVDSDGSVLSGAFAAAAVAVQVSANPDPTDDLDLSEIPNLTSIEKDSAGLDVFRIKVVSGTVTNDFEDLLQGGVSPLMPGRAGGVAISHLRMAYTTDGTFDALMTRVIVDQTFVNVREYCYDFNALRRGNTAENRELLRSGIEALLIEHQSWVRPLTQPDGTAGYNVSVVASPDERQMIVKYQGQVIRGVQTILIDADLFIAV
jgi:hypothetical protein